MKQIFASTDFSQSTYNIISDHNDMHLHVGPELEAQFLFYLIPVLIGIQLALYFIYQYYKIQDVNLKLNRILLSFVAFISLLVFGALFLNVSRIFGNDSISVDIFSRLGWAFALSSPIGFLSFIVLEEFSTIMNLKFVKIVMVLGLIPIVMVLTAGNRSPFFMGTLIFAVISAYYIIGFQIKLIKRTMGNIKKRFILFFTGEIISLIALPFAVMVGLGIFESPINEIIYFSGVAILLSGFITIFISAIDFPPFYEFEWKDNLLKIFVVNEQNNTCLYYNNIAENYKKLKAGNETTGDSVKSYREHLFSGGISGIETIISTITDTKGDKINRIQQENSLILLEYGTAASFITYALIVKKDMKSIHHLLNSLKNVFELLFKEVLLNLDNVGNNYELIFGSFDIFIQDFLRK